MKLGLQKRTNGIKAIWSATRPNYIDGETTIRRSDKLFGKSFEHWDSLGDGIFEIADESKSDADISECGGEGGKPGPCPEDGAKSKGPEIDWKFTKLGDVVADADANVAKVIEKTKAQWAKLKDGGKAILGKLKGMYLDLEAKHGRAGAIAIFAAGHALGLATPLAIAPGSTIIGTAAVARAYNLAKRIGKKVMGIHEGDESALSIDEVRDLGMELWGQIKDLVKNQG